MMITWSANILIVTKIDLGKLISHRPIYCIKIDKTYLITYLITYDTEYTWQEFDIFYEFRQICSVNDNEMV